MEPKPPEQPPKDEPWGTRKVRDSYDQSIKIRQDLKVRGFTRMEGLKDVYSWQNGPATKGKLVFDPTKGLFTLSVDTSGMKEKFVLDGKEINMERRFPPKFDGDVKPSQTWTIKEGEGYNPFLDERLTRLSQVIEDALNPTMPDPSPANPLKFKTVKIMELSALELERAQRLFFPPQEAPKPQPKSPLARLKAVLSR